MNRREHLATHSAIRKTISKLVTRAELYEVETRLDGRITELRSEVAAVSARNSEQFRRIDERLARIDESIFKIGRSVVRIEEKLLQRACRDYGPNLMLAALVTIIVLLCWR